MEHSNHSSFKRILFVITIGVLSNFIDSAISETSASHATKVQTAGFNIPLESFSLQQYNATRVLGTSVLFILMSTVISLFKNKQKIQKESDRVKTELEKKSHDLQTQTMDLIRMNNSLNELEEGLKDLKSKISEYSPEVQKLINSIKVNKYQEKQWEDFNQYFNSTNNGFVDYMKEAFPQLTRNDIKICLLILMNLSRTEIATMLNIECKSVSVSMCRIKKKLGLSEQIKLSDYLFKITRKRKIRVMKPNSSDIDTVLKTSA